MAQSSEAVCFTAGAKGAPFSAGVIHAWLAAGREHPEVAAGISTGALSAAAMQRCYHELEAAKGAPADIEAARWRWFRRYLEFVTRDPFDFVWRAFPDPVDFASDKPPVVDRSAGSLQDDEAAARRHFYLLTRLGVWLARFPLRLNSVADFLVQVVRWKERYGFRPAVIVSGSWALARILSAVFWHVLRAPTFFFEHLFKDRNTPLRQRLPHPLLGWRVWLACVALALLGATLALAAATVWLTGYGWPWLAGAGAIAAALVTAAAVVASSEDWRTRCLEALSRHLAANLDISIGLLHPYHLKRRLLELFRLTNSAKDRGPKVGNDPFHIVPVCAALQDQWQRIIEPDDPLVEGLVAAMAVPGVFPPVPDPVNRWDLIDGSVVSGNPISALFHFLRNDRPDIGRNLERPGGEPSVHVVYNVPIGPYDPKPGEANERADIVEAAFAAMELQRRRDTRQQVIQANFRSQLQSCVQAAAARAGLPGPEPDALQFRIFADEIAPPSDMTFANAWAPRGKELLAAAAMGCRAAMERLYAGHPARAAGGEQKVACAEWVARVASFRRGFFGDRGPGLPEICGECSGILEFAPPRASQAPAGIQRSFGQPAGTFDPGEFKHLDRREPRIVFVASGGVFRGAFHIGSIGALHALEIRPHLVVGASVGALMGGALSAISVLPREKATEVLHGLADVFLHVDEKVALTATLKSAVKHLGVRARSIKLSPSEVRRMVRRGSRSDPGYAAAGAPPALIDALSTLFLIPHGKTSAIAGQFVAGHFSEAVNRFLAEVRTETLPSLDIRYALMGVSLLEARARELLGEASGIALDRVQPYHRTPPAHSVSFFSTTSFVNRRMSLLLGRDFLTADPSYDFVMAGLSSSAFPAVFSPRTEAEVLPGRGRADVYFSDGGMFDNLPFLPAIEILAATQAEPHWAGLQDGDQPSPEMVGQILSRLKDRVQKPDVLIAAALDADPEDKPEISLDTLFKIRARAKSLEVNLKIRSFDNAARRSHQDLATLVEQESHLKAWLGPEPAAGPAARERRETLRFLDRVVNAAVLKIAPADGGHVNGTFQFCRSVGMKPERIRLSIADGCFQTLVQVAGSAQRPELAALAGFAGIDRLPAPHPDPKRCAWFDKPGGGALACPFAGGAPAVALVRRVCAEDPAHLKK